MESTTGRTKTQAYQNDHYNKTTRCIDCGYKATNKTVRICPRCHSTNVHSSLIEK